MKTVKHYDVVIIGAGLAGLALARHLLLYSDKKVLLVERRSEVPPKKQKVGESTVQVSAYYYAKVLDLEEHLLREHFLKYNLRYYWKTHGRTNDCFEHYSQAYIQKLSNICCYQLDRNKFEGEMFRLNCENPNFTFRAPVTGLSVALSDGGPHSLSFNVGGEQFSLTADWVVDTSGRGKFLARQMDLGKENPIRHGASFLWVDGLVNIDKLTDLSSKEIRLKRDRAATGHTPLWLATNHFMGEGFWFWVIPLHGKTSLGLVYDNTIFPRDRVSSAEKLIEWACEEFPLFARDLPHRKILDKSSFKDFSYDCVQTISKSRWAISGEAGRFTDPLYSPGSDLISLHNTLIVDAILTADADELAAKCWLYEQVMEVFYQGTVPAYAVTYDALGDHESFVMKYTWELSLYFAFYVFPFINDLFTDRLFLFSYLGKFSRLGPINQQLQAFISAYYQWRKREGRPARAPIFHDFMDITPLRRAEKTFYRVGVSADEARRVLDLQLANLRELARYLVAHVYSVVLSDERALTNRAFVESIDLYRLCFDPAGMCEHYARHADLPGCYQWSFDVSALAHFHAGSRASLVESQAAFAG
jgi:2-polyprenyl-6-methoxyphenol hydroxylase-like FAD-dependent oxidoreductase